MDKLKPCPFCGEEACTFHIPENTLLELSTHPNWRWRNPGMWVIGCDTEECMGNFNHVTMVFMTEEDAKKAWNRRAGETE